MKFLLIKPQGTMNGSGEMGAWEAARDRYFNIVKQHKDTKVPIRRGCSNNPCYCTGKCQVIIGWRDKDPLEK